jgi:cytosine/uracil/thiamine/allantoin permease
VVLILNSIFPSFLHMRNTLPESAAITTPALTGYLVYMAVLAPIIMVPPHKLNWLLWPAFLCTCVRSLAYLDGQSTQMEDLATLSYLSSRSPQSKVDMLWFREFAQRLELTQEVQFEFWIGLASRQPPTLLDPLWQPRCQFP